jgi:hypothetical protein
MGKMTQAEEQADIEMLFNLVRRRKEFGQTDEQIAEELGRVWSNELVFFAIKGAEILEQPANVEAMMHYMY